MKTIKAPNTGLIQEAKEETLKEYEDYFWFLYDVFCNLHGIKKEYSSENIIDLFLFEGDGIQFNDADSIFDLPDYFYDIFWEVPSGVKSLSEDWLKEYILEHMRNYEKEEFVKLTNLNKHIGRAKETTSGFEISEEGLLISWNMLRKIGYNKYSHIEEIRYPGDNHVTYESGGQKEIVIGQVFLGGEDALEFNRVEKDIASKRTIS